MAPSELKHYQKTKPTLRLDEVSPFVLAPFFCLLGGIKLATRDFSASLSFSVSDTSLTIFSQYSWKAPLLPWRLSIAKLLASTRCVAGGVIAGRIIIRPDTIAHGGTARLKAPNADEKIGSLYLRPLRAVTACNCANPGISCPIPNWRMLRGNW